MRSPVCCDALVTPGDLVENTPIVGRTFSPRNGQEPSHNCAWIACFRVSERASSSRRRLTPEVARVRAADQPLAFSDAVLATCRTRIAPPCSREDPARPSRPRRRPLPRSLLEQAISDGSSRRGSNRRFRHTSALCVCAPGMWSRRRPQAARDTRADISRSPRRGRRIVPRSSPHLWRTGPRWTFWAGWNAMGRSLTTWNGRGSVEIALTRTTWPLVAELVARPSRGALKSKGARDIPPAGLILQPARSRRAADWRSCQYRRRDRGRSVNSSPRSSNSSSSGIPRRVRLDAAQAASTLARTKAEMSRSARESIPR